MSTHMVNINISIKKEAYEFLKRFKTEDKSFSDVILEFKENEYEKGSAKSLLRFAGALKHVDWDEGEKRMKELRRDFDERMGETTKYIGKSRR